MAMVTRAAKQAARDAMREADWKETLAAIRARLPIEPKKQIPPRRKVEDEASRNLRSRERELLLALCDRQEWKCFWCGTKMTDSDPESFDYRTLEHVVARSTGLSVVNHLTNLRAACNECNNIRGRMTSIKKLEAARRQTQALLEGAQTTISRHKTTMAGRCYWCKIKFHLKEWLHKRRHRKPSAPR